MEIVLNKKERERWFFEKLRGLLPDLLSGEVEQGDRPDIRAVSSDGSTIGIEVTELLHSAQPNGDSLQAQESLRNRIVRCAQMSYEKLEKEPVIASVHFDPACNLRKADVPRLVEALEKLVRRNLPEVGEKAEEQYNWLNREYFPEEIHSILLHRFDGQSENVWNARGGTFVPALRPDELAAIVAKKSSRVGAYRKNCDKVWLLIVANGLTLASIWTIEREVVAKVSRGPFDRAFVLHDLKRLYELEEAMKPLSA